MRPLQVLFPLEHFGIPTIAERNYSVAYQQLVEEEIARNQQG